MREAPKKETASFKEDPTATEKAKLLVAAYLISSAFTWSEHPWGEDFWAELDAKLKRMDRQ